MVMKFRIMIVVVVVGAACASFGGALTLEKGFRTPPSEAKPQTWYHLMNGNISLDGITCDLEAMAKAGLGGLQVFEVGCFAPRGPVSFGSPEWFSVMRHIHAEAKRLGLEVAVRDCSGWSLSGGPWITPADSMKTAVFTETNVEGPKKVRCILPREQNDNGFYADIAVLAYPTPAAGAALGDFKAKAGFSRKEHGTIAIDKKDFPASQMIDPKRMIDLTCRMAPDGTLEWDAPPGKWTVLRCGFICSARYNHAASATGYGLEVDKLSKTALDKHFDAYLEPLCDELGIDAGGTGKAGVNAVILDSYEVGCQNWTQGFEKEFETRMGYSVIPWLPVVAGRIVGSVNESERFLEDYRRALADLFAENYVSHFAELCHARGLKIIIEPYGGGNADNLRWGRDADIPMGEFWSQAAFGPHRMTFSGGFLRIAAHLAHVWGRKFAAAEAFTSGPPFGGRWLTTPFSIKSLGDKVFAEGINRIVYHRFTHQPWAGDRYLPGMTMGRWGIHLDRTQTWWHLADEWFRYQSRCQWMLQEGVFVADALYWCGEEAPNDGGVKANLPQGYKVDSCQTEAVERLRVVNGRIVAPGGVEYKILILPQIDTMSEKMVRRIGELVSAGAKVVAQSRPVRAPGLAGRRLDDYRRLVEETWKMGVMEAEPAEALKRLGIQPDFAAKAPGTVWLHRKDKDADWYFVARDNERPERFEASFRVAGRAPEIWDPVSGAIADAPVWREENGRTIVLLDFPPSGSTFVVFRRAAAGRHVAKAAIRDDAKTAKPSSYSLLINKAEYFPYPGSVKNPTTLDFTGRLAAKVRNNEVYERIDDAIAGGDPARGMRKRFHIEYEIDGESKVAEGWAGDFFRVPDAPPIPPPDWEWIDGPLIAWSALSGELEYSDGAKEYISVSPAKPLTVAGPWQVSFGDRPVKFQELVAWNECNDLDVRYFSGTATYRKRVSLPERMERVMLDLGEVCDFAEVSVNGIKFPALWKPPFRLDITDALEGTSAKLEIKVTNRWPNRLIGDDILYPDDCKWSESVNKGVPEYGIAEIPEWVVKGGKSPTGRHTFTTWKHWTKEDALLPSGLLGPVVLRFGKEAKISKTNEVK